MTVLHVVSDGASTMGKCRGAVRWVAALMLVVSVLAQTDWEDEDLGESFIFM